MPIHQNPLQIAIIVTLASVTAIDTAIAASTVYYLRKTQTFFKWYVGQGHISHTETYNWSRRTHDVITWLIVYSVNTGIILV